MPERLIQGFKEFKAREYCTETGRMPGLVAAGQAPEYFIISCIDSRANPATVFDAEPGMFFAFRAMGAIVRLYKPGTALAASLQFALTYNPVKEIIILGHTGCGAIKALVEKLPDAEIASFMDVAQAGLEKAKTCCGPKCSHDALLRNAEEQIALQSAENLKTYPSVQKALAENRLKIHVWLFDMSKGELLAYDDTIKKFTKI